jgi:hypothetical protein
VREEQRNELMDDQLEYLSYADTKPERIHLSDEIFEEMGALDAGEPPVVK